MRRAIFCTAMVSGGALFCVVAQGQSPADNAKTHTFESEMWAGECLSQFRTNEEISLKEHPAQNAKKVGAAIPAGKTVTFKNVVSRTIMPLELIVPKDLIIDVRSFGAVNRISRDEYYNSGKKQKLSLAKGVKIQWLQDLPEGHSFFQLDSVIFSGSLYDVRSSLGEVYPEVEQWMQISGGPKGWVALDKKVELKKSAPCF